MSQETVTPRVLMIDDEPDQLHNYMRLAEELGIPAVAILATRQTDREFISHLMAVTDFTTLITDFGMPNVDGLEVLRIAREVGLERGRPFETCVMISADNDHEVLEGHCRELGARFLRKPFKFPELVHIIQPAGTWLKS